MDKNERATDRFDEISALKNFSPDLIKKCKSILNDLPYVPEIIPAEGNGICFDFYRSNGDSLNFEISEDKTDYFKVQKRDLTNGNVVGFVKMKLIKLYS